MNSYLFIFLTIFLALSSCKGKITANIDQANNSQVANPASDDNSSDETSEVDIPDSVSSTPAITNVVLENDTIKITGSNLKDPQSVNLNGTILSVIASTSDEILLSASSALSLALDTALTLTVTTANGASAVTVTFNVEDNSITSAKIADDQIDTNHLKNNSVTADKIADSTISSAKLNLTASSGQFLQFAGGQWQGADLSGLTFMGGLNATTGLDDSASSVTDAGGSNGQYYIINTADTIDLGSGAITFAVGDWAIHNGTVFQKIDNSVGVKSVNGSSGDVTIGWSDITTGSSLGDLDDVDTTGIASGKVLKWDGSNWVIGDDETVSAGSVTSSAIQDATITTTDLDAGINTTLSQVGTNTTDIATNASNISANVTAIATKATEPGSACTGSNKLQWDGSAFTCVADIDTTIADTNTNAATLCAANQYLDGDGTCKAIPVDTDTNTNAQTICTGATFLDGDGNCVAMTADTDTNTNAATICSVGEYLDGDGTCKTPEINSGIIKGDLGTALSGTVDVNGTVNVVGSGTAFTTELAVGDAIEIAGEVFTIATITDDSNLTLDSAHTQTLSGEAASMDSTILSLRSGDSQNFFVVDASGNVGIGEASPSSLLDISGSVTAGKNVAVELNNTDIGAYWRMSARADGDLDISVNGTDDTLRLDSGGNVGIGKNNPSTKLDVDGTITATAFVGDGSGLTGINGTTDATSLNFAQGSNRVIDIDRATTGGGNNLSITSGGAQTGSTDQNGGNLVLSSGVATGSGSSKITFQTNPAGSSGTTDTTPTTAMTILGSGNVGIGTINPSEKLQVKGGDLLVGDFGGGGDYGVQFSARDSSTFMWAGNVPNPIGTLQFGHGTNVGTNSIMTISSNGNVGIGTSTPSRKLAVAGGDIKIDNNRYIITEDSASSERILVGMGSDDIVRLTNNSGGDGGPIVFGSLTSGNEAMRVDSNGNVGIGTTTPASLLDVNGAIRATQLCDETGANCKDVSDGWVAGTVSEVSFHVHRNSVNQTVANGSTVTVDWTTTDYNNGSGFDLVNDRFQPTTAGKYLVVTRMRMGAFADGQSGTIQLRKNGTMIARSWKYSPVNTSSVLPGLAHIVELNGTTDYVDVAVSHSAGSSNTLIGDPADTFFTGYLLSSAVGASDDLGDHSATQNITLGSNYISGDGDSEGLSFDTSGNATFSGTITGDGSGLSNLPAATSVLNASTINFNNGANRVIDVDASNAGQKGWNLSISSGSTSAGTADTSGGDLSFSSGQTTGSGTSSISFSVPDEGTGGATTLNSLSTAMTIAAGGKVGIGTTSPARSLHVQNNSQAVLARLESSNAFGSAIELHNSDTGGRNWSIASSGSSNTSGAGDFMIYDQSGGAERFVIDGTTGNVGIGTTSPTNPLHIAKGDTTAYSINAPTSGGNSDGTEILRLHNTDNSSTDNKASLVHLHVNAGTGQSNVSGRFGFTRVDANDGAFVWQMRGAQGDQNFFDEVMRIDDVGNVGIGTSSPTNNLDVRNNTNTTQLHLSGSGNDDGAYILGYADSGGYFSGGASFDGSNWIAKSTSASVLGQQDGVISFWANTGLTIGDAFTPTITMRLTSDGDLGLGTTNPTTKLHIFDDSSASATGQDLLTLTGSMDSGTVGSGPRLIFREQSSGTAAAGVRAYTFGASLTGLSFDTGWGALLPRMVIDNIGKVGIGTTTPTHMLDISNSVGNSNQALRLVQENTVYYSQDIATANKGLRIRQTGTPTSTDPLLAIGSSAGVSESYDIFKVENSGNVGIGSTSPDDALDVVGDVDATGCFQNNNSGTIGGTCVSDERLKEDITPISNSLKRILGLRPVEYVWRADYIDVHRKEGRELGLIAQEVEDIFPDMVVTRDDGYKRVKYDISFTLHIINSIKEFFGLYQDEQKLQDRRIASLEEENNKIKEENQKLQNELQDVRSVVCDIRPDAKVCNK